MSGPKVVRIVTREEVIATCQGRLAQLDKAIARWQAAMSGLGCEDTVFLQETQKNRQQFAGMLEQERFLELQKEVADEIRQLQDDIQQRKQIKAEAVAKASQERRQRDENVQVLMRALVSRNITLPDKLNQQLALLKKGEYPGSATALLNQVYSHLSPSQPSEELTEKQQAILSRMTRESEPYSHETFRYQEWLRQQPMAERDQRFVRLDRYLGELAVEDEACYQQFKQRLALAESETNRQKQSLLLDSVMLDIAAQVKESQTRNQLLERLELVLAEWEQKAGSRQGIEPQQLKNESLSELSALLERCEQQLLQMTHEITASYRQQTILQGLASLGYDVREGMQTQWLQEGRLAIKNPAVPGYGVELAGQGEHVRLQIRTVKFDPTEDKQRDSDVETLWCEDFDRLQKWLAARGEELVIERALPAGQVAVKQVEERPAQKGQVQHKSLQR